MTTRETGWQEAIITVLQDTDGPLKYDAITQIIGERGLRSLTGATPANTVNSYLNGMTNPSHQWYDSRVEKVGRGVYQLATADDAIPSDEPEEDDILEEEETAGSSNQIVRVAAFGLYWEKAKVKWNASQLLGRPPGATAAVNFADQQGIYILHQDRSVAYVGRTTDSLYARLRAHSRDHKSVRWDKFSWFGFRDIDDQTGELKPMPGELDTVHLINILESVLIEALEPPVNGRRGDFLGHQCEQVPHPEIAVQQTRSFLQNLIG